MWIWLLNILLVNSSTQKKNGRKKTFKNHFIISRFFIFALSHFVMHVMKSVDSVAFCSKFFHLFFFKWNNTQFFPFFFCFVDLTSFLSHHCVNTWYVTLLKIVFHNFYFLTSHFFADFCISLRLWLSLSYSFTIVYIAHVRSVIRTNNSFSVH